MIFIGLRCAIHEADSPFSVSLNDRKKKETTGSPPNPAEQLVLLIPLLKKKKQKKEEKQQRRKKGSGPLCVFLFPTLTKLTAQR